MSKEIVKADTIERQIVEVSDAVELALVTGDLGKLTADQRKEFYNATCKSLGLNPLTRPFGYFNLPGSGLQLYARKDCTDQLRAIHGVAVAIRDRKVEAEIFWVVASAHLPGGRQDEDIGAVSIAGLTGNPLANAFMKAHTKAKRRVTLSICGLGMTDETEIETIEGAYVLPPPDAPPSAPIPSMVKPDDPIVTKWRILLEAAKTSEEVQALRVECKTSQPPPDDMQMQEIGKHWAIAARRTAEEERKAKSETKAKKDAEKTDKK